MDTIDVHKLNEVYFRVTSEPHVEQELHDYFKFEVPGMKFSPQFRKRQWNGYIYLYSIRTKTLYCGLIEHLKTFCKERDINLELHFDIQEQQFTSSDFEKFCKLINLPMIPRDYQQEAFIQCVRNRRQLTLSPTGSGKSLIIYLLSRLYTLDNNSNRRVLIIVPTISLIHQMSSDFVSYGYNEEDIYKIQANTIKETNCPIVISTWQSIYKLPRQWFNQFKLVIGDEAHLYKAKSLTTILNKLTNCKYRFGFTGTLDNIHVNKLVLEGIFGPVYKTISTKELMDREQLANLEIKIMTLQYTQDERKYCTKLSYQDEMDFIVNHEKRNNFIKNLTLSLEGNTLVLYQYVDKHGKVLHDLIKDSGKPVYFVHGGIEGVEREEIRNIVENSDNNVIIASYGTFSTGINIQNLNNVIFASPSKSKIRNLQSIGRGLRVTDKKKTALLIDIADDLQYRGMRNYTMLHLLERVKIYNSEQFDYKILNIPLQGKGITKWLGILRRKKKPKKIK